MKINNIIIKSKKFAYDGCHKIYLLKRKKEEKEAINCGYLIFNIEDLDYIYNKSCILRFIQSWDLKKTFVAQLEDATFEN